MAEVVVVGSYNRDLMFKTDELPGRGETRLATLSDSHGGKGFNQAIACNRLGIKTLFVGCVGPDNFSEHAGRFATEEGLDCAWQVVEEPTGVASVAIEASGENQILVAPGANHSLSVDHVERQADTIRSATVVLAQEETSLAPIVRAFELAIGIKILNPAPYSHDHSQRLLPMVDVVTPNENEFERLCESIAGMRLPPGWQLREHGQLHQWCRQLGVETVVVTMGATGAFVSTPAGGELIAARQIHAVDTCGAGDAFNGALAAGICRHPGSWQKAAFFANQAAAVAVTRPGAAPSMARLRELPEF